MNPQMPLETQCEMSTYAEATLSEHALLASWGFNQEEIAALLQLQRCYQAGGSDRASIVRHLEFLRLLVKSGDLEL